MDVTPAIPENRQVIQSYGSGYFTVSGQRHTQSIIVTPMVTVGWDVPSIDGLSLASINQHAETLRDCSVLLVGMGDQFAMLAPDIRVGLKELGIVPEAMSTDAACRTYNVLLAEDRKVAAALVML